MEAESDEEYNFDRQIIFDTRIGSYLPAQPARFMSRALANCKGADDCPASPIVFVGETHTNPMHHHIQLKVLKATQALSHAEGSTTAVGLEMFYRQHQNLLDRYIFGTDSLADLRRNTGGS